MNHPAKTAWSRVFSDMAKGSAKILHPASRKAKQQISKKHHDAKVVK